MNLNTPADHESQVISSEIGSELEACGQGKFEFQNIEADFFSTSRNSLKKPRHSINSSYPS